MDSQRYNQAFQETLARLNPAQRKAVDSIDGPVLVIAGPGTGKTQILAARIGNILTQTDAGAHNILCLTYTDAGAVAMRRRLYQFIGPDAYRVSIHTFHAFCNEIIQYNLHYFGKHMLEAVSDLEQIEILREVLDSLDKNSPLKRFRGNVYYELPHLRNLFSVMKREDWSREHIEQLIAAHLKEIDEAEEGSEWDKLYRYQKNGKDYKKGDWKPAYKTLQDNFGKTKEALALFDLYNEKLLKRNRYDFDDMIGWILKAFKTDRNFLLNYQERYQYILVDEFQDTSGAQYELVNLLCNYWDKPNVFVVGDDDQSIFRFQGANVENVKHFIRRHQEDHVLVRLEENYRSSQPILDTAYRLIERNPKLLEKEIPDLDKRLAAKNLAFASLSDAPKIVAYASEHQEMAAITNAIEQLIAQGVQPQEIAVIYKEHKSGEQLARYFLKKGIAVQAKRKLNLLEVPLSKMLLNILRYIVQERDVAYSGDALLFEILHYDCWGLQPIEVAQAFHKVYQNRREHISIRNYLCKEYLKSQTSLLMTPIEKLTNNLEQWIKDSYNTTLQQLFEQIIIKGGIVQYLMAKEDKLWQMQVLTATFDFIKAELSRNPDLTLESLIQSIDLLSENGLSIPLHQNIYNEKGVQFMTAHGSKGLEFEYVFFMGCTAANWEKKRQQNSEFALPDNLFDQDMRGKDEAELRRLFYVALTRAKKFLQLSFAEKRLDGKDLEASVFVSEIQADSNIQPERRELEQEALMDYLQLQFMEEERVDVELIEKLFIDHYLDTYQLSVTHLNNYLDCPLRFYFQNLISVPAGKSEAMEFGSAVHDALNILFDEMKKHPKQEFAGSESLVHHFKEYMYRHRGSFTREQYKRRLEYGEIILPKFYDQYHEQWNKIVSVEINITGVHIDGIPIKGKLDKLEFDGKSVNVVDYKTGKFSNARKKFGRPTEEDPIGGDYWRQAVFYKILIDNDRKHDWVAVSSEFDFVEPEDEEYRTQKVVITPEDVKIVTKQIKEVYARIKAHDFKTGCGKADCEWCTMVKTYYKQLPVDLLEEGD